uniref:Uncharacterized protein n=1 Tax=Arundo donax TaxID=35708 RepID=A0A0A8YVM9_ARUDO
MAKLDVSIALWLSSNLLAGLYFSIF